MLYTLPPGTCPPEISRLQCPWSMVTCRQSPPRDGGDHVHIASRIAQNWQCHSLRCEGQSADAYASIQPGAIPSCLRSRFQCGSDRCSVRATFCQHGQQGLVLKHDTAQCRQDERDRQTTARLAHFLPVTAGNDRTCQRPVALPAAPHPYPARPRAMLFHSCVLSGFRPVTFKNTLDMRRQLVLPTGANYAGRIL